MDKNKINENDRFVAYQKKKKKKENDRFVRVGSEVIYVYMIKAADMLTLFHTPIP